MLINLHCILSVAVETSLPNVVAIHRRLFEAQFLASK